MEYRFNIERLLNEKNYMDEVIDIVSERLNPNHNFENYEINETKKLHNSNKKKLERKNKEKHRNGWSYRTIVDDISLIGLSVPGFDISEFKKALIDSSVQVECQRMWKCSTENGIKTFKVLKSFKAQMWKIITEAKSTVDYAKNNINQKEEKDPISIDFMNPIKIWYDKKSKTYKVLDGAHTLVLALAFGIYDLSIVEIFADSYNEAAFYGFIKQNSGKTKINNELMLCSEASIGDDASRKILDVILNCGYNIDNNCLGGIRITCLPRIKELITKEHLSIEFFENALIMYKEVYEGKRKTVNKEVIEMLMKTSFITMVDVNARNIIISYLKRHNTIKDLKQEAMNKHNETPFEYIDGKSGNSIVVGYGIELTKNC